MKKTNHGQVIEQVIRRRGISISEVARFLNVNRKSVYNWFRQDIIKPDVIFKLGVVLEHDFSVEFPHYFETSDFENVVRVNRDVQKPHKENVTESQGENYWKNKYVELLEKYNELLASNLEAGYL